MVDLILVSHGMMANGIVNAGKMIIGDINNVYTVSLSNTNGIDSFNKDLEKVISNIRNPDGILIMCDLKGGSPFNVSLKIAAESKKKIRIISGLNLSMFLETVLSRQTNNDVDSLLEVANKSALNGISIPDLVF